MALAPPTAQRRRADGTTHDVPVKELAPDDVVLVRPGERLPTDGQVVTGSSAVDQSPVTGESVPVEVAPGREVFGGTVNGTGVLEVKVTKPYQDTVLARIIRQVQEAQAHRGQAQRFADRFGAIYTPAMVALAALVAVIPPLLGGDWRQWLYRGLVVLTVSCSCALVISVPVAVVAAISRAARDGVLIKGGVHLEALGRIRVVALDKTGTLTQGRPELTDVITPDANSAQDMLALAAAVEAASEHPLASAILAGARQQGITWPEARDVRALPGVGVKASVDGQRFFVGRPDGRVVLPDTAAEQLARLEAEGKTAIVLADADDGHVLAVLAVADQLRPNAADTVADLHALGIGRVVLLTGDNPRTAQAIAAQASIGDWRAGLLPEDKTAAVAELRAAHGPTVMVGDGVNDAPALATADVGVAMGAAGTDVALETADVALMADDLAKLPQALRLARRALANIRQNIALSLATIAVLVVAALAGRLSLTSGLLLNEGTALLIIANGLRLLRPPQEPARVMPALPDSYAHVDSLG
jgi:Cd2+/Zn2+-exporting ATPase